MIQRKKTVFLAATILCVIMATTGFASPETTTETELFVLAWAETYGGEFEWRDVTMETRRPDKEEIQQIEAVTIAIDAILCVGKVDYDTLIDHYSVITWFIDYAQFGQESLSPYDNHALFLTVSISPIDFLDQSMDPYTVTIAPDTGEIIEIDIGYKG